MAIVNQYPFTLTMIGANGYATDNNTGSKVIQKPHFKLGNSNNIAQYVNIQNLTSNIIKIFSPTQDPLTNDPVYIIGAYMQISIALNQFISEGMQLYFVNSAGDNTVVKNLMIIWSDESLNWNHSVQQSYSGTGGTPNAVNIVNQPTVNIGNTPNVNVANTVPVTGNFDGNACQCLSVAGSANSAVSISAPAVAGKKVRLVYASATSLGAAVVTDAPITISDGASVIYRGCYGVGQVRGSAKILEPAKPMEGTVGNAVTMNIAAAGAGVIVYANIGFYYE